MSLELTGGVGPPSVGVHVSTAVSPKIVTLAALGCFAFQSLTILAYSADFPRSLAPLTICSLVVTFPADPTDLYPSSSNSSMYWLLPSCSACPQPSSAAMTAALVCGAGDCGCADAETEAINV